MNCEICHEEFTTESRITQLECCHASCHTSCMFQNLVISDNYIPKCSLCFVDLQHPNIEDTESSESVVHTINTTIPDTPEFLSDLKKVKKLVREKNKCIRAFNTVLSTESTAFKNHTKPILENLKELKNQSLENVRNTPEYKNALTFVRKENYAVIKLREKYILHWRNIRDLGLFYSRRYNNPSYTLKRRFRL